LRSAEIELSDRKGLVAAQPDEVFRKHIVAIFGDLNQYMILWIFPERVAHVAVFRERVEKNGMVYEVLFWREGLRKEQVIKTRLSKEDARALTESVDRLISAAVEPKRDRDDLMHTERKLLFKRFENGNTFDWHEISIRSDTKSVDFQRIAKLMLPKIKESDDADIRRFLNGNGGTPP